MGPRPSWLGPGLERSANQEHDMIRLEIWLYGPLAAYGGDKTQRANAMVDLEMPDGTMVGTVVDRLGIPLDEKGITFVNGQLADMPGVNASRDYLLKDGDRVGIFHRLSMWPAQYRQGASTSPALQKALQEEAGGQLRNSPATIKRNASTS
jgi:putative ubiquitin-RnfH superfamily antitoxin RatB of RatAB toxin-antitoxin module